MQFQGYGGVSGISTGPTGGSGIFQKDSNWFNESPVPQEYVDYDRNPRYMRWDVIRLSTDLQSSYKSNNNESRPKTKFFSLMIYAGYPA